MPINLRDVSAIKQPAPEMTKPAGHRKRGKKQLRKLMKRMTDPHKVINSPKIISGKDLLRISYELGNTPIRRRSAWKSTKTKSICCRSNS